MFAASEGTSPAAAQPSASHPDLDAQYAAAKASLGVAQANYRLAVSTAARWQALAGTPAVSKQEVDVQTAGAEARKAEMEAAAQDVERYEALEAFKRVVAPFDGVVTARLTDVPEPLTDPWDEILTSIQAENGMSLDEHGTAESFTPVMFNKFRQ